MLVTVRVNKWGTGRAVLLCLVWWMTFPDHSVGLDQPDQFKLERSVFALNGYTYLKLVSPSEVLEAHAGGMGSGTVGAALGIRRGETDAWHLPDADERKQLLAVLQLLWQRDPVIGMPGKNLNGTDMEKFSALKKVIRLLEAQSK